MDAEGQLYTFSNKLCELQNNMGFIMLVLGSHWRIQSGDSHGRAVPKRGSRIGSNGVTWEVVRTADTGPCSTLTESGSLRVWARSLCF